MLLVRSGYLGSIESLRGWQEDRHDQPRLPCSSIREFEALHPGWQGRVQEPEGSQAWIVSYWLI